MQNVRRSVVAFLFSHFSAPFGMRSAVFGIRRPRMTHFGVLCGASLFAYHTMRRRRRPQTASTSTIRICPLEPRFFHHFLRQIVHVAK
ncbi:hypothetical protein L596_007750 [Steinernema carpocapsae]|uniref:Uncharacterized protein n=1 Tax=Steinernema carpocapsae TaxID=34508 RepID=A0A4U5PAA8_STECR|nr:hypothetical protein L596_007750 [Steinernema carpocapsae]